MQGNHPLISLSLVTHGSILGDYIAADYPSAITGFILSGFGNSMAYAPANLNQTILYPTAKYSPGFSRLPLSYMVTSSQDRWRSSFYNSPNSFVQQLFLLDFNDENDLGFGGIFSLGRGLRTALAYTGPVLAVTAAEDDVFCSNGQCGTGSSSPSAMAVSLFPKTSYFSYFEPTKTGHSINLHYTAQQSFQAAFNPWPATVSDAENPEFSW